MVSLWCVITPPPNKDCLAQLIIELTEEFEKSLSIGITQSWHILAAYGPVWQYNPMLSSRHNKTCSSWLHNPHEPNWDLAWNRPKFKIFKEWEVFLLTETKTKIMCTQWKIPCTI